MSGHIFISYRREDSRGAAGRIYDRLEQHFGHDRIFMDVDTIQPGMDFVKAIDDAIGKTDLFLVVIGKGWLMSKDHEGRIRLDNPEDFVRLEVGTALKRNVWVIPVLVDRAEMPPSIDLPDELKALTRRNAIEISHTRFSMDVDRLIRSIEQAFEQIETDRRDTDKKDKGVPGPLPNELIEDVRHEENKQSAEATPATLNQEQQGLKSISATPDKVKSKKIYTRIFLLILVVVLICSCCSLFFLYFDYIVSIIFLLLEQLFGIDLPSL